MHPRMQREGPAAKPWEGPRPEAESGITAPWPETPEPRSVPGVTKVTGVTETLKPLNICYIFYSFWDNIVVLLNKYLMAMQWFCISL